MNKEPALFFEDAEEDLIESAIEKFLVFLEEEKFMMSNEKQIEERGIDFDIECCRETLEKFYDTPTLNQFDIQIIYIALSKYLDFLKTLTEKPSVHYVQQIRNEKTAVTSVLKKVEPFFLSLKSESQNQE